MRSGMLRRALCICVVALGIAGVGAGSAQAETTWMVKGANIAEGFLPTLRTRAKTIILIHTKISGLKILFKCSKLEALESHLIWRKLLLWKLKGIKCVTEIGETVNAACEPNNNGTEPGVILTNKLLGELTKHSTGEGVILVKSTVEEVVGGVKQPVFGRIKMSAECPIGSNVPIIGTQFSLKDVGGNKGLEEEKVTHTDIEGPLTEIWALSKTEEHKASISGEIELELESGEVWNGLL